jgi:hypothetical protein
MDHLLSNDIIQVNLVHNISLVLEKNRLKTVSELDSKNENQKSLEIDQPDHHNSDNINKKLSPYSVKSILDRNTNSIKVFPQFLLVSKNYRKK